MEFALNETQVLLRDTAARLVRDRYGFEPRKKILATPRGFSDELWSEYAALGLLGVEIDEDLGGSGGTFADLAVVLEAFGRGLVVEPYLPTVVLGAGLIARAGNAVQKEALLQPLAAGECKLALAYGEPNARYSLNHVETTARPDGAGYLLNGHKAVVLGADSADWLIIAARTSGAATDRAGISLFLAERKTPGLDIRAYPNIDDRRAAEVALEAVRLPAQALLGAAGEGLPHLEAAIDRGAAALCCEAVGAMAALNEVTLDYLKTRTQFGRPIGKFQVLAHRMADMVMAEQQARSMAILAAEQANSRDAAARAKAISAAKVQIGISAQIVGRGAIQLHGGIGLTMEYVAGHYFRRLTAIEMMFGDQAYHLARFASV
jgi:alkylation response protein AidB-like acyl-CoA dehydrogenase